MYTKTNDIAFNFNNKVVLVFGGSKGIGKEVCRQFAEANAIVYNASRTPSDLDSVTDLKCDLLKIEDIENIFSNFDRVDFVINVAGTNLCEPIEYIDVAEWDRVMNINLRSYFAICRQAVFLMKKQNYGRIVNVSSIA